jgi:3',5'-cyclic AMP phosphodiesterase CpdA
MDEMTKPSRRGLLQCMGYGGAGTLFVLSGGVLAPIDLARAQTAPAAGTPLFLQISDTHIGFKLDANPDVAGTLNQTIALVNAMPVRPALTLHTGDISHLSKPEEFDMASQLLGGLKAGDLHTVPGEHDMVDAAKAEYFNRFGAMSANKGWYSFDQAGVHFVALNNVMSFKPETAGVLGADQMAWLAADLQARSASTPIVVFAHMPLWNVYAPWGWNTAEADQVGALLKRFGSVTVLNGHIHQIVQKVEGNVTYHTARSTAYPQSAPGVGGPGPLKVPADQLPKMLGATRVSVKKNAAAISDTTLG